MRGILLWTAMCPPPLIVKDGEVGVDEGHSTMDSHVSPPLIVKDGEVGVDEGHSTMDSHVSPPY